MTQALPIPYPLKVEHEELHDGLKSAIKSGGKTSEAAKEVANILHPHFVKEEEYAMPLLGLLSILAKDTMVEEKGEQSESKATNIEPQIRDAAISMADKLVKDLPHMLEEHKDIVAALDKMKSAALMENKPEHAHLAEKLILHARNEEDILYPAAILVGKYLKK
jgi:hypothetical protein